MSKVWMSSLRALSLALCLILVVAPVARAEAMANPATGVIQGKVVFDGPDGKPVPIPGVSVRVVNLDTAEQVAEMLTGENGTAVVPELPYGTYSVVAEAPEGFVASAGPLVVLNEETRAAELEFSLEAVNQDPAPGGAMRDTARAASGDAVTLSGGYVLRPAADVNWAGDLDSVQAIQSALANGDNVCLEFEAAQQSDRTLMASMINAKTCDEAEAAAYAAAGATGKNRTALLLLGLLGAGAIAIGIAQATDNNNQPDVVTQ